MFRWLFKKLFQLWGWRIEGIENTRLPKKIYVVIPHTSNWDFPVGYFMKVFIPLDVRWIAKDSLFKGPLGFFARRMGGIAVNRQKAVRFVDTMIDLYNEHEVFSTSIAPEGTRKKVEKLKSGYWRIAKGAQIPIIYTKFDWGRRVVEFADPKEPEASWPEEVAYATNHFKDTVGCIPENSFGYPFDTRTD